MPCEGGGALGRRGSGEGVLCGSVGWRLSRRRRRRRAHVALPEGLNSGVVWVSIVVVRVTTRLVLLVSQLSVSGLDPAGQKGQRSSVKSIFIKVS